jgi:hypothetical protein
MTTCAHVYVTQVMVTGGVHSDAHSCVTYGCGAYGGQAVVVQGTSDSR